MGSNLRLLWEHLGLSLPIIVSSEDPNFPGTNVETGDLQQYWQALDTTPQSAGYDAGSGLTRAPNALVIPGADYLVTIGASVDLRWSTDGTPVGTSIGALTNGQPSFPWTPITAGHLAAPHAQHAVAEWTAIAKRGWYLHIYGSVSAPARLSGGFFLGPRFEVAKNPLFGRPLGVSRAHRGLDVELSWGHWAAEADAAAFLAQLAAVTPDAAEGPQETVSGVIYGGLPHYLYDPLGSVFRTSGTPALLPVLCVTPDAALTQTPAIAVEAGPSSVRWRERR